MTQRTSPVTTVVTTNLVELEREHHALLIEYESLSQAWPKEPDILTRAKLGRRVEDALGQILRLQRAIAASQATTLGCVLIKSVGVGSRA